MVGPSHKNPDTLATVDETLFVTHRIPKRSKKGAFRHVIEPRTDELKFLYKVLATKLLAYAEHRINDFPSEHSFGFIRKRSTRENAAVHAGASVLLKADIRDFFQSIALGRVQGILLELQLDAGLASHLARVLCPFGHAAPGLSTSPLVSNLACMSLDKRLAELANRTNSRYSRYADDLSFSGKAVPKEAEVAAVLVSEGFDPATGKFRTTKRGQAHFFTGLSVADPLKPHVPKRIKRRLRQEIHYASKFGIASHVQKGAMGAVRQAVNRIDGMVQYVAHVEGGKFDYRELWRQILERDNVRPSYSPRWERIPEDRGVAIDETGFQIAGQEYLALCAAVFNEATQVSAPLIALRDSYLADPFADGKKRDIAKEGLHYASANRSLRESVVKVVSELPFRAYIVVCKVSKDYESTYLTALYSLIQIVAARCDRKVLSIDIENNSRVSRAKTEAAIRGVVQGLDAANSRRPLRIERLAIADKSHVPCWIADTVLGVFRAYCESVLDADPSSQRNQFERVRHRISLVLNLSDQASYSRRRPLTPAAVQAWSPPPH